MKKLQRFEDAHKRSFRIALQEIKHGKKVSHWMWYIFPQIKGLGFSETSKYYAIEDVEEAQEFLNHPVLGNNLILITSELLKLKTNNATVIFGSPDDMKLCSSMTLFASMPGSDPVFEKVLQKYFDGKADRKTVQIIEDSKPDHL